MKHLLDFRNALIHASQLDETDIADASLVLEAILQVIPLNRFDLACTVGDETYILQGLFPKPVSNPTWAETVQNKELVLIMDEQTHLCSISPLMSLAQDINRLDDEQDIFLSMPVRSTH